jgi:hypothetical protein
VPWSCAPGLAIDVISQMDSLYVNHVDGFSSRNWEVVGQDNDFVTVHLYSVILVEDIFLLGELTGHFKDYRRKQ